MKDFTLYFTSFHGKGREIKFTLTIAAANERDACTVGHRMTEVMGWCLDNVDETL
jgi:hypothetical protein